MMGFFDVNIPYLEKEGASKTPSQEASAAACKATRLRVVVKAMELGYSGVAYNRTTKGVLSDLDRCKIVPFDLSSLLVVAPGLVAAAKFHREILGVPASLRFRQYTRLTVMVDSAQSAAALSSGSAVLRSYHLVSARPLNQSAFDQICKTSEVDLISIDFSQKLPFRLKLPLIKAAIERGLYFEICYSPLIPDVDVRRHILTDAKVLVDLTRGKNLIFSSGATCVTDFRGPYDVINLFSMLGLSMEKAKISLSKNCRCLLNNALRKKEYYDEAIKVQRVSAGNHINSKDWFPDWADWDPISSGNGDLLLDDISWVSSSSEAVLKNQEAANEMISVEICSRPDENYAVSAAVSEATPKEDEITQQFTLSYEDLKVVNAENENPNFSYMEIDDTGTEDPGLNNGKGVDFFSVPDTPVVYKGLLDKNLNLDPYGPSVRDAPSNGQSVDFSSFPTNIVASEAVLTESVNLDAQHNAPGTDFSSFPTNSIASEEVLTESLNFDSQDNDQSVDFSSFPSNIVDSGAILTESVTLDTQHNGQSAEFASFPTNSVASEAVLNESLNLGTQHNGQSVDFSSFPSNIVASEAPLKNTSLNSDIETNGQSVDFPIVPGNTKTSEVFPAKILNFDPDGSEANSLVTPTEIKVSSPAACYTLLQRESKELSNSGADPSLFSCSKYERDSEILMMKEPEKYRNIVKVNGLSFPDKIGSLEVSKETEAFVSDSAVSVETLVQVDKVKDSPASIPCARENSKRGKVQPPHPRNLLFSSKHCIRHLLLKRKCRQVKGSRKKAHHSE